MVLILVDPVYPKFCKYILKDKIEIREVGVIWQDFTKAFGRVDHGILVHEIKDVGFRRKWENGCKVQKVQINVCLFFSPRCHGGD